MLPILHQSYWRDEALSVLLASKGLKEMLLLSLQDVHPPLYYFILHFWTRLFGDAEYVTRSLSLFFHLLLSISVFFLLRSLIKNKAAATFGALATFLNPFLLFYAFEARSYTLFGLLVTLAVLFSVRGKLLASSTFLGLAVLTHNFSVFYLAAFIAYWFFSQRGRQTAVKHRIEDFSLRFGIPLIILFGWLGVLWNMWVRVAKGFWIEPKTSSIFVDAFRQYFRGSLDYPSQGMLYNITLILIILAISYWIGQWVFSQGESEKEWHGLALLAWVGSLPFLAVYAISSFWVPIFHERYLLPTLPLFIVFITGSLSFLIRKHSGVRTAVTTLAAAYLLFALQSAEEIVRKTTKPAINYAVNQVIGKQAEIGEVIAPESIVNLLEVKYYVKKSGYPVKVLAKVPEGKESIPFYLGNFLYEEGDIVSQYPQNKRIWIITPNGGWYEATKRQDF